MPCTKGNSSLETQKYSKTPALEEACYLADTEQEYRKHIETLLLKDFEEEDLAVRTRVLEKFNPVESAKKITALLSF